MNGKVSKNRSGNAASKGGANPADRQDKPVTSAAKAPNIQPHKQQRGVRSDEQMDPTFEALRELSGRLISTQEEERRVIARELHDHIGQELALVCVQVHRLVSDKSVPDTLRNEAQELYRNIRNIALDVSKLSHRLHSTELDFLGLPVAAERLCKDFSNQYGLCLDFVTRDMPPKVDLGVARCLYRVLQEALQSIAKDSRATQLSVLIETRNNEVILTVEDNGVGFDLEESRSSSGLGLVSIRERLHIVGGHLRIFSTKGSGTRLSAIVPL
jgi:signal transduction histidine kinase